MNSAIRNPKSEIESLTTACWGQRPQSLTSVFRAPARVGTPRRARADGVHQAKLRARSWVRVGRAPALGMPRTPCDLGAHPYRAGSAPRATSVIGRTEVPIAVSRALFRNPKSEFRNRVPESVTWKVEKCGKKGTGRREKGREVRITKYEMGKRRREQGTGRSNQEPVITISRQSSVVSCQSRITFPLSLRTDH